jgi:hypothetical protein
MPVTRATGTTGFTGMTLASTRMFTRTQWQEIAEQITDATIKSDLLTAVGSGNANESIIIAADPTSSIPIRLGVRKWRGMSGDNP